jgi:hypothetical protein
MSKETRTVFPNTRLRRGDFGQRQSRNELSRPNPLRKRIRKHGGSDCLYINTLEKRCRSSQGVSLAGNLPGLDMGGIPMVKSICNERRPFRAMKPCPYM